VILQVPGPARAAGADVNAQNKSTALAPLHAAVASNDWVLAQYLVEECNAKFGPDGFGRLPTVIASQCQGDYALADYIFEKEAAHLQRHGHPPGP
jgi:hypothetical protein